MTDYKYKDEYLNLPGVRIMNKEQYEKDFDAAMNRWTPVSQQRMDSHVAAPAMIAFIIALVTAGLVSAVIMQFTGAFYPFYTIIVFGSVFLMVFIWRIGVSDKVMWAIENFINRDIDGDGEIGEGFTPRAIPYNVNSQSKVVDMPASIGPLAREQWGRIATALLNEKVAVSRRGMNEKTKYVSISQGEANQAAKELHAAKKAVDNQLTAEGWDWLITFLPPYIDCLMERPNANPPTPFDGG